MRFSLLSILIRGIQLCPDEISSISLHSTSHDLKGGGAHLSVLYRRTSRMPIRCTSATAKREAPISLVSHTWLTNSCAYRFVQ